MLNIHLVTVKFWFPPSCLIENIRRKTLLQCVDFHDVKNRNLKVHFPCLGLNDICNMDLLANTICVGKDYLKKEIQCIAPG